MRYVVISEEFEESLELALLLDCEVLSFNSDIDYDNYDFFVMIYHVNKGRCDGDVIDVAFNLRNKHAAFIGVGNSGYDINRALYKMAARNKNLVVYSKYTKVIDSKLISEDILNKVVCTDGMEFSERFVGRICRMLYKKVL